MTSQIRLLAVVAMAGVASSAAPPAETGPAAAAKKAAAKEAAELNQQFYNYIFIVLAGLIAALTIWRVGLESVKYVRKLTCLNSDTQRYFIAPSSAFASLKKNLLYAPIFGKRHNREFQLSAAVNVGTLPTRFQLLFLLSYFATNVIFCVYNISFDQPLTVACKEIRNRSGILSVVNMVCPPSKLFLVLMSRASSRL